MHITLCIMTLCVFVDAQGYHSAFFGEGYGPVLLGYVNCNGDEASLLDCEHVNTTLCNHSSDAGVNCFGEPFSKQLTCIMAHLN